MFLDYSCSTVHHYLSLETQFPFLPLYQFSQYSTSSLDDGNQGDDDHGDEEGKEDLDQLIDKLGEEEEEENKRELDEDEKDQDRLDLGLLSKSHAITPITVPEFFPDVPVLALSRNPLFPRFVKMLEASHKIPLGSFSCCYDVCWRKNFVK